MSNKKKNPTNKNNFVCMELHTDLMDIQKDFEKGVIEQKQIGGAQNIYGVSFIGRGHVEIFTILNGEDLLEQFLGIKNINCNITKCHNVVDMLKTAITYIADSDIDMVITPFLPFDIEDIINSTTKALFTPNHIFGDNFNYSHHSTKLNDDGVMVAIPYLEATKVIQTSLDCQFLSLYEIVAAFAHKQNMDNNITEEESRMVINQQEPASLIGGIVGVVPVSNYKGEEELSPYANNEASKLVNVYDFGNAVEMVKNITARNIMSVVDDLETLDAETFNDYSLVSTKIINDEMSIVGVKRF